MFLNLLFQTFQSTRNRHTKHTTINRWGKAKATPTVPKKENPHTQGKTHTSKARSEPKRPASQPHLPKRGWQNVGMGEFYRMGMGHVSQHGRMMGGTEDGGWGRSRHGQRRTRMTKRDGRKGDGRKGGHGRMGEWQMWACGRMGDGLTCCPRPITAMQPWGPRVPQSPIRDQTFICTHGR